MQARLEEAAQCLLVILGATPEGKKELVGLIDGVRESAQSWKELLLDLKRRGLAMGPELAVARIIVESRRRNSTSNFIPLRLDDAPIKGSLAQFLHIRWNLEDSTQEYAKLLECCRPPARATDVPEQGVAVFQLDTYSDICTYQFAGDGKRALSDSDDGTARLWDLETGRCLRVLEGHTGNLNTVAWSADQRRALSGSDDRTVRLWELETGRCVRVLEGHTDHVDTVAWSADQRCALSGSSDKSVRLWDVESGRCVRVLEGHTDNVVTVAWSVDQCRAISGDRASCIRTWDLGKFVTEARAPEAPTITLPAAPDQLVYANAKVLIVGDTSSGKTGLAHRLATGHWKPSDGSTVGAWSTQWKLDATNAASGVERETPANKRAGRRTRL